MHAATFSTLLIHVPLVLSGFARIRADRARFVPAPPRLTIGRPTPPAFAATSGPPTCRRRRRARSPEKSAAAAAKVVAPPQGALPKVPDGFAVQVFATGFKQPRTLRVAPNGDIFLSESGAGRVLVFRAGAGGAPAKPEVFAENLDRPYGIVFHAARRSPVRLCGGGEPGGPLPVSQRRAVKAAGPAEVIVGKIPTERHWTRDLAVSRDGTRLFLAVGSASNLGVGGMPDMTPEKIRQHEETHGRGAAWGKEENRAVVRVFDPEGKTRSQLRNRTAQLLGARDAARHATTCGASSTSATTSAPTSCPTTWCWCRTAGSTAGPGTTSATTRIPALKGKRPDLKGHVRVPEVLIQAHSSALSAAFYDRDAFPAEYRGDAFVALHGSHSRARKDRIQGGPRAHEAMASRPASTRTS